MIYCKKCSGAVTLRDREGRPTGICSHCEGTGMEPEEVQSSEEQPTAAVIQANATNKSDGGVNENATQGAVAT